MLLRQAHRSLSLPAIRRIFLLLTPRGLDVVQCRSPGYQSGTYGKTEISHPDGRRVARELGRDDVAGRIETRDGLSAFRQGLRLSVGLILSIHCIFQRRVIVALKPDYPAYMDTGASVCPLY